MGYEDSDPKTVEALEKIKAILREYDLWAAITVVSERRSHWLYHVDPSWSCMSFEPNSGAVRIRAKRADFNSQAQFERVLNLTTGAIACTRDFGAKMFTDGETLYGLLAEGREITHEYSDPQLAKSKP